MTLKEALEDVYRKRGSLTPQLVVDEARRGRTAAGRFLQDRLEWDDEVASEAHRRAQAAELIRSYRVIYREATETERSKSVRGFHAIRTPDGHTYKPLDDITSDPFARELLLRDMERDWQNLHRRYADFAEFLEMVRRDLNDEAA